MQKAIISISLAILLLFTSNITQSFAQGASQDPDANYDRLDGTGTSGKRVDVIEWEGNLEIHVYPKGSTAGLGMTLDKKNKDKPVMVIAYRFNNNPKLTLTRRAILGIPMIDNFKVYQDVSESEFDKFIISNNGLSGDLAMYKLDPTPTMLYPDEQTKIALENKAKQSAESSRAPASVGTQPKDTAVQVDDNGSLPSFFK